MFSASGGGGGGVQARTGPELQEIQTEAVGFLAVGGDTKIQFLPSAWPADSLPKPTSSLLSIASRNGLIAAAGPDQLIIGTTDAVRETFKKDAPADTGVVKFEPQLSIPIPRVSQVAFSADESSLTICADEGGGLAVYDVQALKQGNTQPAFQISTNGVSIRSLVPNPAEDNAHVLAIVLSEGQLMLANLKERQLVNGPNGPVLREGVSCVSWSAKGKQLVAGLGSGQAIQLTPEGTVKAEIPRPPDLQGDQHMSTISWLSNDEFLAVYTPTQSRYESVPDPTVVLITREPKTSNFLFQKLPDPSGIFGMNRSPPHHFIARLRKFPPDIEDVLIVSSTASGDIGLVTNSSKPLSSDANDSNNNKYTTTSMANDARRAQLPMGSMSDTSPIGVALDLSSKEPVKRPIPAEEIDATSTPLPALVVLNNEGVLSAWWFVYSDSVRQGTIFPGLVAAPPEAAQQQARPHSQQQHQQQPSGFGSFAPSQSPFGAASSPLSSFATTAARPAFGSPTTPNTSAFGSGSAFGGASALGSKQSVWGGGTATSSTPQTGGAAFGQSTFGSPTPMGGGSGFGAASNMGNRQSPWASSTANQQQSDTKDTKPNPFSTAAGNNSSASPFGAMSGNTSSGFASLGGNAGNASSPFGGLSQPQKSVFGAPATKAPTMPADPSFGSEVTLSSNLGSSFGTLGSAKSPWATPSLSNNNSDKSTFAIPQSRETEMNGGDMDTEPTEGQQPGAVQNKEQPSGLFGNSGSGFKLNSTFKSDGTAKDDLKKPEQSSLFGAGFGKALGETEESSKSDSPIVKQEPQENAEFKLPPIKQEPVESTGLQLPAISTPPSPPKQASSKEPAVEPEPAPLPPSPTKQAELHKEPEPAPLPPSPEAPEAEPEPAPLPPSPKPQQEEPQSLPELPKEASAAPEPAPLPPSPKPQGGERDEAISPAGTSPVDLGASDESFLSEKPSDATNVGTRSSDDPTLEVSSSQPGWSFSNVLKSPHTSDQTQAETPQSAKSSYTPPSAAKTPAEAQSASIQPPLFFPRPGAGQESPRSPSPVRNQQPSFSLASATPPRPQQQQASTTPLSAPPKRYPSSTSKPIFSSRLAAVEETRSEVSSRSGSEFDSHPAEPEPVEDEDDSQRIQEELAAPVTATKRLEPFLAHHDYTGAVAGQGVPSQIEKVYRDINSMIDTLGLNARALKAFIKGHTEMFPDGGRDRSDLEKEDDWCLLEIEDLGIVQKELAERLDSERPRDIPEKLGELREDLKSLSKLHARHADIQQTIKVIQNPDSAGTGKKPRLTTEQNQLLSDLRRDFADLQSKLIEAEDSASLLRAKLASHSASSEPGQASRVPTVEAIIKTISKMTRMAEEKSGDVDVLEAKMRKLGFRPSFSRNRGLNDALGSMSLNGRSSVLSAATPPKAIEAARKARQASPGTYTFEYSDSEDDEADDFVDVQADSILRSSTRSFASARSSLSAGKPKIGDLAQISADDARQYQARMRHKQHVLGLLKEKVVARGPNMN